MNYAVNYEFWVDKTSDQYKGCFNQIFNEHRVFTYMDTAVVTPNSDTPYSFAGLVAADVSPRLRFLRAWEGGLRRLISAATPRYFAQTARPFCAAAAKTSPSGGSDVANPAGTG